MANLAFGKKEPWEVAQAAMTKLAPDDRWCIQNKTR